MTAWKTLRVTYYANQDRLVTRAVEPLFTEVRQWVDGAYFVRHWRQGPHLRLNFRCSAEEFRAVEREAVRLVGGYLSDEPSTVDIDREQLLQLHRRLARDEHELGPLTPWVPDNTIRRMRYDTRRHVLDSEEAHMLEVFYDRTTDLAFDMTRAVVEGASRARMAFDLIVATAQALSGTTIERGMVSLRSHSEAFLTYSAEGADLRSAWARYYTQRSTAFRDRVRTVLTTLSDGTGSVPFVRRWLDVVGPLKQRAEALVASGRMTLDAARSAGAVRQVPPPSGPAAYHDWMVETRQDRALVESSTWFLAYRWVLNCTYLHLTRIGLAPVDRFLLCTVAANAVEDELGVRAFDVAQDLLGAVRSAPSPTEKGV